MNLNTLLESHILLAALEQDFEKLYELIDEMFPGEKKTLEIACENVLDALRDIR